MGKSKVKYEVPESAADNPPEDNDHVTDSFDGEADNENGKAAGEGAPKESQDALSALPNLHPDLLAAGLNATQVPVPKGDAEFDDLMEWSRSMGITLSPSLRLRASTHGDGENGIVATAEINQKTECCIVPFSAMLHADSELESSTHDEQRAMTAIQEANRLIKNEDEKLAVRLLYERDVRRERSRWAQYIKHLPGIPRHSLHHWKPAQIQELSGSKLYEFARSCSESVDLSYNELVDTNLPQLDMSVREAMPWLTAAAHRWAISLVCSRCANIARGVRKLKAFVPVFDM